LKTNLFLFSLVFSFISLSAEIVPHQLFCDHAVLQRDTEVPVWGTADPGDEITVTIAGQTHETQVKGDGRWQVELSPIPAGGPYVLAISDGTTLVQVADILFGEVWLCSGQSNMEWLLRGNVIPMINAEAEAARATDPRFRYFHVTRKVSHVPQHSLEGTWVRCNPESAMGFGGVAFFFGRYLLENLDVPIGIINSSWGGTAAESWTRREVLKEFPELAEGVARSEVLSRVKDFDGFLEAQFAEWYELKDPGSRGATWSIRDLHTSDWEPITLPEAWENAGHPDFDGVAWFRKHFDLPSGLVGNDPSLLRLGVLDYYDTVWVNGILVGSGEGISARREYAIPGGMLKEKGNVVAVRILDGGNLGGFRDKEAPLDIVRERDMAVLADLKGEWKCQFTYEMETGEKLPPNILNSPHQMGALYNGMITPLLPYAMRGVAWYQGESNARRAKRYRDLFPAMIADWRAQWGIGDFPFLYVQIAPYVNQLPEIREAQLMTLERSPNTAMVVTTDVGNPNDIHPLNKGPVGERLGLAARALAYGEAIEYSGPIYSGWEVAGDKAIVSFDHTGGALVVPGGRLRGFTMAGADGVFHPAEAVIEGKTVVVTAGEVKEPRAVRYGWSNTPEVNLFNDRGLPASPFRTDVD